jgi:hypothetical protein
MSAGVSSRDDDFAVKVLVRGRASCTGMTIDVRRNRGVRYETLSGLVLLLKGQRCI